jgi:hypothetical protein
MTESKLEKDIRLVQESLEHWKENLGHAKNAAFKNVFIGRGSCALCKEYNRYEMTDDEIRCLECPIYMETREQFCVDTPYEAVSSVIEAGTVERLEPDLEALVDACLDEVAFLKGLLEKLMSRQNGGS